MKTIKQGLLIGMMMATITGYSQVSNQAEMVKKIFTVFKNKDEQGFVKLFPDAATIKDFMHSLIAADTSGELGGMMKNYLDELTDSSMLKDLRRDFQKYSNMFRLKGVYLDQASFVSFRADSVWMAQDGIQAYKLKGKIYFNSAGKEYFLAFDDVIWFENKGWYGVEIERLDETKFENESENNSPMQEEGTAPVEAIRDSVQVADSIASAMEKKRVQQPKQPVKPKSAKTKTARPARKPD